MISAYNFDEDKSFQEYMETRNSKFD
jgi:hypothetical protein